MKTTQIYIIRHGETDLNAQGKLQGHVDIPLNENGRKLAKITGDALKDIPFDLIFSSPLVRAMETARLVTDPSSKHFQKSIPIITDKRLMEIDWGAWDQMGCMPDNFEIPCPDFNLFYTDPFHFKGAPDGESIAQVCERTGDFWQELSFQPTYRGKCILISAHGCSVRGLLYQLDKNLSNFWRAGVPDNCSVSLIEISGSSSRIIFEDRIYYDASLCINPYKTVESNVF